MESVEFEDIRFLFSKHEVWCTCNEMYWYENMWNILKNQELTVYEEKQDRYHVMLYAVCLMLIFSDFSDDVYDEPVCFDDIAYELRDELPELILGQLCAAHGLPLSDDADKALLLLAQTQMKCVLTAIKKEIGMKDLFTSLCAVFWQFHTLEENEDGIMEEEDYDPESAEDFWAAFHRERKRIFAHAEMSLEEFCDAYDSLDDE